MVGAVVDRACWDVEEIQRIGFLVVCRGVVPNVGSVSGYGHVNVPIQCGGVSVSPGDIIIVDGNGVVVIPQGQAEEVLASTRDLLETEHVLQDKIRAGATIGELVDIDEVFGKTFDYQRRAIDER